MPSCFICHHSPGSFAFKEENVHIHKFPVKNKVVLAEWIKFSNAPRDTQSLFLCTKHFKKDDVIRTPLRTSLRQGAVPLYYPPSSKSIQRVEIASVSENEVPSDSETCEEEVAMLSDILEQVCRICCKKNEPLIHIFETVESNSVPIAEKIKMYLPLQIELEDKLPKRICSQCFENINKWHDLVICSMAVDSMLREYLVNDKKAKQERVQNAFEDIRDSRGARETVISQCSQSLASNPEYRNSSTLVQKPSHFVPSVFSSCSFCHMLFKDKRKFRIHRRLCKNTPSLCEICGWSTDQRYRLKSHMRKHFPVKTICDICGKSINTVSLKEHLKIHLKTQKRKLYKCDRCNFSSGNKYKFQLHQISHGVLPHYFCEQCLLVFWAKEDIENHKCAHISLKRQKQSCSSLNDVCDISSDKIICKVCSVAFHNKILFVSHLNTFKICKCSHCHSRFKSERGFLFHKLLCQPQKCRYCTKVLSTRSNLITHELLHTKREQYVCNSCGRIYYSRRSLFFHQRSHLSPSFMCSFCGKMFSLRYQLKIHILRHSGVIYRCNCCKSVFSSHENLRKHEKNCKRSQPVYKCSQCNRTFAKSNRLKIHLLDHDGQTYKCDNCKRKYCTFESLRKHQELCHQ